jgi:DNA invertase Pin-like site-specific DNA recombinase
LGPDIAAEVRRLIMFATAEIRLDDRVRALKDAGCAKVFEEAASGGRWDRPELQRLLDQLRAGDTLVVWKLDRLSRSLKDLLTILERVDATGAKFR